MANIKQMSSKSSINICLACVKSLFIVIQLIAYVLIALNLQSQLLRSSSLITLEVEAARNAAIPGRSPVIMVPGFGGSRLEAKVDPMHSWPHPWCWRPPLNRWFTAWLNLMQMTPLQLDCLVSLIQLRYDSKRPTGLNAPGVSVRPYRANSTDSVYYLGATTVPFTDYFRTIIDELVRKLNYQRDIDIFGAAYDFRRAPHELSQSFLTPLKQLIEMAVHNNHNRNATIICHSLGCNLILLFLDEQTPQWRHTYIRRLVTLSAPFQGSMRSVTTMLFGYSFNLTPWLLNPLRLRQAQRSFSSLTFLFPTWQSSANNTDSDWLVLTADGQFGPKNFDSMLDGLQLSAIRDVYNITRAAAQRVRSVAPQVDAWCLYGSGVSTMRQLDARNASLRDIDLYGQGVSHTQVSGWGDGTVNEESLNWCQHWPTKQSAQVHRKSFDGIAHIDMIRNRRVVTFITDQILASDQKPSQSQ